MDTLIRFSRKKNVIILLLLLCLFTYVAFNKTRYRHKKPVVKWSQLPTKVSSRVDFKSYEVSDESNSDTDLSHLDENENEENEENEEEEVEGGKGWIKLMDKAKEESGKCGITFELVEREGCQINCFMGEKMLHISQQGTGIMYNNETLESWHYLKTRDNICKKGETVNYKDTASYNKVIILRSFRSNAWFHCFMETLPSFLMMKDMFDADEETKIFYSHITQKQLELIKMMGFDMSRVLHSDKAVFGHQIIFPIQKYNSCHFKLLRRFFQEKFSKEVIPSSYFLIIQRKTRGIENFDEVLGSLTSTFPDQVFKVFYGPETMEETRLLFKGAKAVIAPHGAGTANAFAFSKDSLPFLEITRYKDSERNGIWRQMGGAARSLDFQYSMLVTELKGIEKMTEKERKKANFFLSKENINDMTNWIRDILQS